MVTTTLYARQPKRHQLEEFRNGQEERGDTSLYVLPISQNPVCWNPCWLSKACATVTDPESAWLSRDNLETNPTTIKPETVSPVTEPSSWVPLPAALHPVPLPHKVSCFVSICVSLDNSLLSIGQEPTLRPWKESPFLQHKKIIWESSHYILQVKPFELVTKHMKKYANSPIIQIYTLKSDIIVWPSLWEKFFRSC